MFWRRNRKCITYCLERIDDMQRRLNRMTVEKKEFLKRIDKIQEDGDKLKTIIKKVLKKKYSGKKFTFIENGNEYSFNCIKVKINENGIVFVEGIDKNNMIHSVSIDQCKISDK